MDMLQIGALVLLGRLVEPDHIFWKAVWYYEYSITEEILQAISRWSSTLSPPVGLIGSRTKQKKKKSVVLDYR